MEIFNYHTLEELRIKLAKSHLQIPLTEDISPLLQPVRTETTTLPNSIVILPMEGCDGTAEGAPDVLTRRRYLRFARSGAAVSWFEAMAVCKEGRGNARQLYLGDETWESFAAMLAEMRAATEAEKLPRQMLIAQLTHAGRYANPKGVPAPVLAEKNPILDRFDAKVQAHIITDEELAALEEQYVHAAMLAKKAGFDAVDIKACHRYLVSDLLSAYDRPGIYGGSYENRTRFLRNVIRKVHERVPGLEVTLRLNGYDAVPRPWGWGTDEKGEPDLEEPKRLLRELWGMGVTMANISCGNPYYNPHVGRPYDNGPYEPPLTALQSEEKMLSIIAELQKSVPEMAIVCTGMSWFRQYGPNVAAAGIREGAWRMAGFGRQAFAYPTFARDLLERGALDPKQCCTACSNCTVIMRDHGTTGCAIRDSAVYLPILRAGRVGRPIPTPKTQCDHIP